MMLTGAHLHAVQFDDHLSDKLAPLLSNRQRLSYADCLEVKRENNQNCSVLCFVQQLCTMICTHKHTHTREQFLHLRVGLGLDFVFSLFRFSILCVFCVSSDHFIPPMLFAFVVFCLFATKPGDWLGRASPK